MLDKVKFENEGQLLLEIMMAAGPDACASVTNYDNTIIRQKELLRTIGVYVKCAEYQKTQLAMETLDAKLTTLHDGLGACKDYVDDGTAADLKILGGDVDFEWCER